MYSPQSLGFGRAGSVHTDGGSDEEMDWEEVTVPSTATLPNYDLANEPASANAVAAGTGNIEITIRKAKKVDPKRKQQAEQSAELRVLRLTCHKIHTVALLSNALTRNKWINDPLLHARLLSMVPLHLQTSFTTITKKSYPDPAKRGRLFETALMRLTEWWFETFDVLDYGHIKSRTFIQVIRNSKSLMRRALEHLGSRDVSAQLFTSLCRALGLPTRLVVSIQSVPWKAGVGKQKQSSRKPSKKGKEKAYASSENEMEGSATSADGVDDDDDDMEEVPISSPMDQGKARFPGEGQTVSGTSTPSLKGKEKALPKPVIKLRKSKPSGQRLGSSSGSRRSTPSAPVGGYPPVFWTEVFSRADGKWLPVDPIRYIVNKRKVFEPPPSDRNNRMVYVVAVEEDGYCRDVTPRYAKEYGTKTTKAQLGGKGRKEWWESVMALDEEFEFNKYTEGMPTSVAGFKDHPMYALEQHLKREEVIFPKTELGKFRGESVYPRSNVIPLKTAENWMRMGRRVKEGAQAMKLVKQRAVTIHRRRAMELAQQDGDEMLQGLYSEAQTELYVPEPIVDVRHHPKKRFRNIDLYTPSMLPTGAAHIPYKGAAKVAKKLGFDYAEAVTSFEFKKGRAFPVLSGIVVASDNEEVLLEAYWEAEREAEEKERAKRKERVIKRWTRLIHGLRIRQRLQEQYANGGEPALAQDNKEDLVEQPGGFLTEADAIVQPFHLPRFEHGMLRPSSSGMVSAEQGEILDEVTRHSETDRPEADLPSTRSRLDTDLEGEDNTSEEILPKIDTQHEVAVGGGLPKTMRELAEEMAVRRSQESSTDPSAISAVKSDVPPPAVQPDGRMTRLSGRRSSKPAVTTTKVQNRKGTTIPKRSYPVRKRGAPSYNSEDGSLVLDDEQANEPEDSSDDKQQRTRSAKGLPQLLRARMPKNAEKVKAEREAEEAYRKAIAE
ncbi:Rad4-domain-containing protein [Phellopilus nigrolimitatus]|nr:Rad4-domain-containing protein [Phellopilus nigrolimitatus]